MGYGMYPATLSPAHTVSYSPAAGCADSSAAGANQPIRPTYSRWRDTVSIDGIGYVRSDISGSNQRADEEQLRSLAKRRGYNLRKTIVFGSQTDDPERRLGVVLSRMQSVEVVLVPNVAHFDGGAVPDDITRCAKVVVATSQSALGQLISKVAAGQ